MGVDDNLAVELAMQYSTSAEGRFYFNDGADKEERMKVSSMSFMLNGVYFLPTSASFTPYLMAGVGYNFNKPSFKSTPTFTAKNSGGFGYNLGAGVDVAIDDTTSLDLGYRFVSLGSIMKKAHVVGGADTISSKIKLKAHRLMLGARFKF